MTLRIPTEQFGQLQLGPMIATGSGSLVCRATDPRGQEYALRLTTLDFRLDLGPIESSEWEVSEVGDFAPSFLEESKWATLAAAMAFGVPVHEVFYLKGELQLPDGQSLPTRCGAILMDVFDGTLQQVKSNLTEVDRVSLLEIIARMLATGFLSDDIHDKNILYKTTANGRLWRFIDFEIMQPTSKYQGYATEKGQTLVSYYLSQLLAG